MSTQQSRKGNIAKDFWTAPEKRDGIKAELASVDHGLSNPCIARFGPGPDGAFCGGCSHRRGVRMAKTYWKCELRSDLTHGAKTDQKAHWAACARFERISEEASHW